MIEQNIIIIQKVFNRGPSCSLTLFKTATFTILEQKISILEDIVEFNLNEDGLSIVAHDVKTIIELFGTELQQLLNDWLYNKKRYLYKLSWCTGF